MLLVKIKRKINIHCDAQYCNKVYNFMKTKFAHAKSHISTLVEKYLGRQCEDNLR